MNFLKDFRRRRSIRKSQKPTLDSAPPIPSTPVTSLKPTVSNSSSAVVSVDNAGQEKGPRADLSPSTSSSSQPHSDQQQSQIPPQPQPQSQQFPPRSQSSSQHPQQHLRQPQPHSNSAPQLQQYQQQRQQYPGQPPQNRERRRMPEDGMQQGNGTMDDRRLMPQRRPEGPEGRMRGPPPPGQYGPPQSPRQMQPHPNPQRPYPNPQQPHPGRRPGPPPKTAPAGPIKIPVPAGPPDLLGLEGLGVVDRYPRAFLSPRTEFMTTSLQGKRDSFLDDESPSGIVTLIEANQTPRRMSLRSQRSFTGRPLPGPNGSRANTITGDPRMHGPGRMDGMFRTQSAVSLARPSSCLEAQMDPRGAELPLTLSPHEYIGPTQRPATRPSSRMRAPSQGRMMRGPPSGFPGFSGPMAPHPERIASANQQPHYPRRGESMQQSQYLMPNGGQYSRPPSSKRSPSLSPAATNPPSPTGTLSHPASSATSLSPSPMARSLRNPSVIPTIAHIPFQPRTFPKHQLDCMQGHKNMTTTPVQHAGVTCALCVRLAEENDLEMKCCNWCALKVCSECALAVQTWGGLEEVEKAVEEANEARRGAVTGDDVSSGNSSTSENSTGASSRTSWGEEVMMAATKGPKGVLGQNVQINTVEIAST
ncbi:hypothetical protein BJ508DRAFT_300642 [Ascobolus immersus RN42]|uniref:Uncharacterized protein n=1 Tax=Ascobolus immersus RN42 TaxID=1160509 RepID=A0A3N4IRF2_ASCIM|nr:hypothetical protein BJ508DRAFT_300642 [Ascobolus immersus RN42]